MKKHACFLLMLSLYAVAATIGAPDALKAKLAPVQLVRWPEMGRFAQKWLTDVWATDSWDGDADLDSSFRVDFSDFALWAQLWSGQRIYFISYDPYADADWNRWHRALAQHHDHMERLSLDRIRAYDNAGYSVIVPLDYAGKRSRGKTYCNYRLWPVYKYLAGFDSDQEVLAALNNIKLFVPSMEEIGCDHLTSPFLATYIELWEPDYSQTKQQWHYETTQQCIDLINKYGGLAIIAHPTGRAGRYTELNNYKGIEMFSAFYYQKWLAEREYPDSFNYIQHFKAVWDFLLTYKDTKIWGFAVNDWYGPWKDPDESYSDSGKILVMIPGYSMDAYRKSLEAGCFFAIYDWGQGKLNKNKYPAIASIKAVGSSITIDTDGDVIWIANGEKVAQGNAIDLMKLPTANGYKYVRAEISNAYGTVYTQPWSIALFPQ